MNPIYQTSARLKERARNQLEGKYGAAIGITVLAQLASYITNLSINMFIPVRTPAAYVLRLCASFIVASFTGVFQVGITLFCLNIACGRTYGLNDLLYGYRNQFEKALILSMVNTAVTVIYQFVLDLPLTLYQMTYNQKYIWLSVAVLIPAFVIFTYLSLLFSQIFYLFLDFPSYSAGEILKAGIRIMKGHKGRLLYISLSFIPLILLSFLTCGLGMLWVTPYMNMTMTNFYLDLMNPSK